MIKIIPLHFMFSALFLAMKNEAESIKCEIKKLNEHVSLDVNCFLGTLPKNFSQ